MIKKKEWISLIIGILGSMLGLYGVVLFNRHILFEIPMWARIISRLLVYWLIALVPIILIKLNKEKLSDYGFEKNNILSQIINGILIGVCLSIILTLIPHILGFSEYVSNNSSYGYIWQFVFELVYCIITIGMVEEFVFRGFIYSKMKNIFNKEIIAIIGSSILFGLFHIFNGSILQIIVTAIIGVILCIIRLKIKKTTTLSLAVGHGIYDFLITVFTVIFK